MALAVVDEEAGARAEPVDEKIKVAVAIDVGEGRAGGVVAGAGEGRVAAGGGDVCEAPVAQVAEQAVVAVEPAQEHVAPAVAVEVAEGDARAGEEVAIGDGPLVGQGVGEGDPDRSCGNAGEPRRMRGDRDEALPPMPVARLEGVGGKGGAVQEGDEDEKEEGLGRRTRASRGCR